MGLRQPKGILLMLVAGSDTIYENNWEVIGSEDE